VSTKRYLDYKFELLLRLGNPNPRTGDLGYELEELLELPLRSPDEWAPQGRLAAILDLQDEGLIVEYRRVGAYATPTVHYELAVV